MGRLPITLVDAAPPGGVRRSRPSADQRRRARPSPPPRLRSAHMPDAVVEVSGTGLTAADVVAVARGGARAVLHDEARRVMEQSAAVVARLAASPEPVYGVSTGFGSLANVAIPPERREELQRALVRSHAAGMGPPVETEVVRAMMLLRARSLAMGCSGARPALAETMLALLNAGCTPVVPEFGSLGASGGLAPLAPCALLLIGEGEATAPDGERISGAEALERSGAEPLVLR